MIFSQSTQVNKFSKHQENALAEYVINSNISIRKSENTSFSHATSRALIKQMSKCFLTTMNRLWSWNLLLHLRFSIWMKLELQQQRPNVFYQIQKVSNRLDGLCLQKVVCQLLFVWLAMPCFLSYNLFTWASVSMVANGPLAVIFWLTALKATGWHIFY